MKWIFYCRRVLVRAISALIFLLFLGFGYESILASLDRNSPDGELISIGDRNLHLLCMGGPSDVTVVLEAGGGNSSTTSRSLQREMAKFVRVCAYDRAGFGDSDPVSHSRTFDEISADLNLLLTNAKIEPPYLLVGESMGGLLVRNYQRLYPDQVAGLVLLDAAEEEHTFSRRDALQRMRSTAGITKHLARFGIVRAIMTLAPSSVGVPEDIDPKLKRKIISEFSRPTHFQAVVDEMGAYFSAAPETQRAGGFGELGDMPLVVVTHGIPLTGPQAFLEKGWAAAQERLAALSSNSKLIVAEESGHAISLDQPELVVDLVQSLVDEIKSARVRE